MGNLKQILGGQASRFVIATMSIWALAAYFTLAPDLLLIESAVMTSVSVAIMVAYSRVAFDAFLIPVMTRAHILGLGIFLAWSGTAIIRFISILYWGFKLPVTGTDFTTLAVFFQLMAGCLHLSAPAIDPGGVWPIRDRIKAGLWAGLGVLVLLTPLLLNGTP